MKNLPGTLRYISVSYTHLDVYKRQIVVQRQTWSCFKALDRGYQNTQLLQTYIEMPILYRVIFMQGCVCAGPCVSGPSGGESGCRVAKFNHLRVGSLLQGFCLLFFYDDQFIIKK